MTECNWYNTARIFAVPGRVVGRFVVIIYISAVKRLQWSLGNPEASNPGPRMGRTVFG